MICVINGAKTACKTNIYMYIIIGAHKCASRLMSM